MTKILKGVANQTYVVGSTTKYQADVNGIISGVSEKDVGDLINGGCSFLPDALDADVNVPLNNFKLPTGLQLAASASTSVHGLSLTVGTSQALIGETANSATKTDSSIVDFIIPENYDTGADLTLTANVKVAGAGTLGTCTIDLNAYQMGTDGAASGDLCATAAQDITATATDYAFTITGTTLKPGDVLTLKLTTAVQETAGTNINGQINSVRIK